MALDGGSIKEAISTPELFCAWRPGRKSSGEPWNEIVSDWFQQKKKTIKSVSDWSIQARTRAGERAVCLACERFFLRNV